MQNFLQGFKTFCEQDDPAPQPDKPGDMVAIVKKQLNVPKKIWMGMPLMVSNVKMGKRFIREPTMFYVTDFDRHTVTLISVPSGMSPDSIEDDDGEIDMDADDIHGKIEITISRDDFYDLQEPQGMQAGGDLGGGGGML